ncbi:hypothetical protein Ahy_A07g034089 [Arachis hypogaea]|uniref:Uncharacterized protein n=1 Tax=Arachis hypogaea TaxID=3818 RepID=A0A445CAY8_ARAHY|nr:hypothetical protein Ahy_A07g034089 [Arachis hypogaea]
MRGKFFAGLRTTSRYEALHSQVARFVKSGYSIKEFLHHFRQWIGASIGAIRCNCLYKRGDLLVLIVIVESVKCDNS